jgi:hypothetical protein
MNATLKIFGHEQYITNSCGDAEFIVIPIEEYKQLVEFIEDYGLGLAMQEAEDDKTYSKEEALKFLEDNEN